MSYRVVLFKRVWQNRSRALKELKPKQKGKSSLCKRLRNKNFPNTFF